MEILLKRTESDSQVHHEVIFCDRIRFVLAIYVHMSRCPGHIMHHRDLLRRTSDKEAFHYFILKLRKPIYRLHRMAAFGVRPP